MGLPIATKSLGVDTETQLNKRLEVYNVNIDTDLELVTVKFREVLIANGVVVKTALSGIYTRFNSKIGDRSGVIVKPVTQDNLKFDALRASQVGLLIAGMIEFDIANYAGPESLQQIIFTEPVIQS